jgi:hypothetical protein
VAGPVHEHDDDSYCAAIERHFTLRRGSSRPGNLTHLDYLLARQWEEEGIGLEVARRGIDEAFQAFHGRHPAGETIGSLAYCSPFVRKAWKHALQAGTGQGAAPIPAPDLAQLHHDLLQDLKNAQQLLLNREPALPKTAAILQHTIEAIEMLGREVQSPDPTVLERIEEQLKRHEATLLEVLEQELGPAALEQLQQETQRQLEAYRSRMQPKVFAATVARATGRRLFESCHLPRFTLLRDPVAAAPNRPGGDSN